jgi:hypothetical protein
MMSMDDRLSLGKGLKSITNEREQVNRSIRPSPLDVNKTKE